MLTQAASGAKPDTPVHTVILSSTSQRSKQKLTIKTNTRLQ